MDYKKEEVNILKINKTLYLCTGVVKKTKIYEKGTISFYIIIPHSRMSCKL